MQLDPQRMLEVLSEKVQQITMENLQLLAAIRQLQSDLETTRVELEKARVVAQTSNATPPKADTE